MVRGARLLLLIVAGVLAAWVWVALHPSPEKLIRKQLDGVAHAVSFGPNEGYIAKLSGAEGLANFFSTNVDVKIDVPGHQEHRLAGREEIQQAALGLRASLKGVTVTFPDIAVVVNADKEAAIADVTLQVKISGEQEMIVQEVKFTFGKINGKWLIVKVETVRTLQ